VVLAGLPVRWLLVRGTKSEAAVERVLSS